MNCKILVTGGSGLVGQALKSLITDNNKEFLFLSSSMCDLRNKKSVDSIFESFNPDIVVHLANKVAGLYGNLDDNYTFLVDNIKMNTNILESCKKYNAKKLINILSTCVFPDKNVTYPLTSNQILNGPPHHSNEGYAYSKRILLTGSELLSKQKDIKIINLIPTNLYGENDNYHLVNSHVIPGLIHKCYLAKLNKTPLVIKGSGIAQRQFLYAKDLAQIILNFIETHFDDKTIKIIVSPPSSDELNIKNLVEKIIKIFQFDDEVIFNTSFPDGQISKTCDSNELLQFFPNFTFTNFNQGLHSTIEYFIENYHNIRK